MNNDTHVYLVSAQATPNVTPALDTTIRPESVVLLVSEGMQKQADWLEQVLKQAAGVKVERWSIEHPWDIEHIQERVLQLLDRYDGKQMTLNVTGGTKPMSIAAYEAFRAWGYPIFYVHPEKDQVIWMHPSDRPRQQLANRISITHFIEAHGARVLQRAKPNVPTVYRELGDDLVRDIDYFSGALGVLNYYAHTADKTLKSEKLDGKHRHFDAFQALLERLEMINIVKVDRQRLDFASEDARFFANGGWLEQYVLATLNSLKKDIPAIQDTAMSLEIEREESVRNEIDIAFLVDNRLHLIECKARNFTRQNDPGGANAIYKLDSITDVIGGIQARSMLISYKPLSGADRDRAESLKVKVLQVKQLQSLKSQLAQWIRQAI